MDRDEIATLCREVLEDRKRPHPMTDPLPLSFRNPRRPVTADTLDANERRQAVAVGQDGIGAQLSPDDVFGEDAVEEGLYAPEVWDVFDAAGALAYRVWMYGVDNGTVFRGATTEVVGGCSQGGLHTADPALAPALVAARDRIPAEMLPDRPCIKFLG